MTTRHRSPGVKQDDLLHGRPTPARPFPCGRRIWQWAAIVAFALVMASGGCGSSDDNSGGSVDERVAQLRKKKAEESAKDEADRKAAEAAAKKAAEEEKAKKRAGRAAAANASKKRAAEKNAAKPPAPVRPKNIAEWKEEDYFSAMVEGDPRLTAAIRHLATQQGDATDSAALLTRLLKAGEAKGPKQRGLSTEQIQAILETLVATSPDSTRGILEQILTGEWTVGGSFGTQVALKLITRYPTRDYESIFFRLLTQAPAEGEQGTETKRSPELDAMILNAVPSESSGAFRVKLAEHILDPATSGVVRARLAALLEQPRADNLAAQTYFFRQFRTPAPAKARLTEYFTVYGSETLRRLLDIPQKGFDSSWSAGSQTQQGADGSPRAAAYQALHRSPEIPPSAVTYLWTADFAAYVADILYHLDSVKTQPLPVLLANTIPLDTMRSSTLKTLELNWQDGPGALEAAGVPNRIVTDPGLNVVVKCLLNDALGANSGRRPSGRPELQEARKQREKVTADWARFSANLTLTTTTRLELASRARAAAGLGPGAASAARPLPLELHDSARVVARYRTVWPNDARARAPGATLDGLRVDYVRIEETNRYRKLLAHYKRQMGTREEFSDSQGVWLENVRDIPESGTTLSIDVVIRKAANNAAYEALDADEKLTVDVLAIEIHNPRTGGSAPAAASPAPRVAAEPGR